MRSHCSNLNAFYRRTLFIITAALLFTSAGTVFAQDEDIRPAPSNIGTTNTPQYNGVWPSENQKELIGPYKLLKAGMVNDAATEVTLPLYEGRLKDGRKIWYVLTDTSDAMNAQALGLLHSAKLAYAEGGRAVRVGRLEKSTLVFESGTVDFRPVMSLTPGDMPNPFPPKAAQAGSVGDRDYSPLVKITNAGGHIYNAPMIAFDVDASRITFPNGNVDHNILHDKVIRIDPAKGTVTLKLTPGMSFARPVSYLSFDTNDPVASVLEESTHAPAMSDIKVGGDDAAFSAVERLFVILNGPMGKGNPQRQGIFSAIVDGGGPLNIFGGVPTIAGDYSPMWDLNLGVWTQDAIDKGYRSRLMEEFQILGFAKSGYLTAPGGKPFGSTGIIVNCPPVMRLL